MERGAPYNAIIVTAGASRVPAELPAQLAIGERMVIPVGSRYVQELYKITKHGKKNIVGNLGGCRFVSLIGKDAWEEGKNSLNLVLVKVKGYTRLLKIRGKDGSSGSN